MCAQVAPSAKYLRGHGRVAVDVTASRRLWQHLPVLGLVILACVPVYAVVVAVCQLLNEDYISIIITIIIIDSSDVTFCCLAMVSMRKLVRVLSTFGTRIVANSGILSDG